MAKTVILVVEDDPPIRRGLCDALAFAGYSAVACARGDECLDLVTEFAPDLVLLDVLLPGTDGFTLLGQLRCNRPQLPIIMLTALGTEGDKVRGLTSGADDYVVKPFSATEVLARVEAVLRRSAERPLDVETINCDGKQVHFARREITGEGGESDMLSELEADILRYLVVNQGRAIDRAELLQRVWKGDTRDIDTRTIDMHIRRLRTKIEAQPSHPKFIRTVRNKGYMFSPASSENGE